MLFFVPFQCPRALVVDDHADAAEAFARLLRLMGCEVMAVTDPFLAVDAVAQLKAQVVFLDIGMPGMDGLELARRLRAKYGFESLRIVAVTAYGEEEHRTLSRQAGFDAHVVKPVDIHLVESMLQTLFPG
jgi:CheY-like chemotaxis protein